MFVPRHERECAVSAYDHACFERGPEHAIRFVFDIDSRRMDNTVSTSNTDSNTQSNNPCL